GMDQTAQQALWSRSDSTYNNFRIPSLIVTQKGTVLAFAEGREGGDSGDIDILLKRSEDGGQTWSKQSVIWDDGANTCGNPCPVVDQTTGRIFLWMTWNLGSDHEDGIIRKKSKNTRKPYLCFSDDDGLTWSEPADMSLSCKNPSWGWYATGPGVGIQLQSEKYRNRLIIPANHSYDVEDKSEDVRGGYGYGSHVIYSDDGGLSWTLSETITPGCNESQVVELSNGDLMMNMRSYNKKGCRAIAISHDGGASWLDIKHDPQLVESVCQASLIEYGSYQGKRRYLFSNPAVPSGRTHMTIQASFDGCLTWTKAKLVHEGPAAYSCMTVLPDESIGLFYEAGESDPYEQMVFVIYRPDELFR
ncbi:MAG: sialidase family protein, partial [Bacteroidota bacterium]|nr:sialidase family protein [Bacteroidota bacterium]